MHRRALCIGINDYPFPDSGLNGCVNDARAWASLLVDHYDFARADVTLLTDARATTANVIAGLKALLAGARAGDLLVFSISSHGTYIADVSGEEETYDQALCPYDCADVLLLDDMLNELFSTLHKGVHLTVICDSCFTGAATRVAVAEVIPGLKTPDDRRVRFLSPLLLGRSALENTWKAQPKSRVLYPQSWKQGILLRGCGDKEYSYDALMDAGYHGVMTYFAIQAIREASYKITYAELKWRLRHLLHKAGYPQHPQIEGSNANKKRQVFT